ncbi:MAG: Gfo/Idh/MocA family oxidoreductase, partial [Phycisphaerales bacterium]|nr:Gfo/Idh/MocA family oxidoreductase [Phycisphaerales bacterium]
MPQVRIGVLGLGFMGQTHVRAIQAIAARGAPCRLTAVCDASPERLNGRTAATGNYDDAEGERLFDPGSLRTYTNADAFFADPEIDVVHVCTWTDSHVDFAIAALQAGKHVLVEKPVAVRGDAVERLAKAVARTDRVCMPAMCMRFWPGWTWLKERIADGAYGPVHSAVFRRLGTAPGWGDGFYTDTSRSGGALVDLHIHD